MLCLKNELKNFKKKIYNKQVELFNIMHENNYSFDDKNIKMNINEINLLEEIYDIKLDNYNYESKKFWEER